LRTGDKTRARAVVRCASMSVDECAISIERSTGKPSLFVCMLDLCG
jgi:hypothetical protein